jgi:hypothetical protein
VRQPSLLAAFVLNAQRQDLEGEATASPRRGRVLSLEVECCGLDRKGGWQWWVLSLEGACCEGRPEERGYGFQGWSQEAALVLSSTLPAPDCDGRFEKNGSAKRAAVGPKDERV